MRAPSDTKLVPDRKLILADPARLKAWIIQQLDALDWEIIARSAEIEATLRFDLLVTQPPRRSPLEAARRLEAAMQQARCGNPGPLRKLFPPELAEFIHPPPLGDGQHRPIWDPLAYIVREQLQDALADVKRIRQVCREKLGRVNLPRNAGVSVYEIAEHRNRLPIGAIEKHRKHPDRTWKNPRLLLTKL